MVEFLHRECESGAIRAEHGGSTNACYAVNL